MRPRRRDGDIRTSIRIRAARPADAGELSDLALRSKAHWGYDAAFLDACREELTVNRERIEADDAAVLEIDGVPHGFYVLRAEIDGSGWSCRRANLDFFYLDPASIGAGYGRLLWGHMLALARRRGYRQIFIHSDPNAEGFYRAMGARCVGEVTSGSIVGRTLPLMRYEPQASRDGS